MKNSDTEASNQITTTRGDVCQWRTFLSQVDYKPGWSFALQVSDYSNDLVVRFKMLVWDTIESRNLKPIVVVTDYEVPRSLLGDLFEEERARQWLRQSVHRIEQHEADEWLRFSGSQLFNPHDKPQNLGRRPEGWEWLAPQEVVISPTLKEKSCG